jgi:hypothetical protein
VGGKRLLSAKLWQAAAGAEPVKPVLTALGAYSIYAVTVKGTDIATGKSIERTYSAAD